MSELALHHLFCECDGGVFGPGLIERFFYGSSCERVGLGGISECGDDPRLDGHCSV